MIFSRYITTGNLKLDMSLYGTRYVTSNNTVRTLGSKNIPPHKTKRQGCLRLQTLERNDAYLNVERSTGDIEFFFCDLQFGTIFGNIIGTLGGYCYLAQHLGWFHWAK